MEHKPGTPETNTKRGATLRLCRTRAPSVARKAGKGSEEDWLSQASGDPAFWLKEPEHEAG